MIMRDIFIGLMDEPQNLKAPKPPYENVHYYSIKCIIETKTQMLIFHKLRNLLSEGNKETTLITLLPITNWENILQFKKMLC